MSGKRVIAYSSLFFFVYAVCYLCGVYGDVLFVHFRGLSWGVGIGIAGALSLLPFLCNSVWEFPGSCAALHIIPSYLLLLLSALWLTPWQTQWGVVAVVGMGIMATGYFVGKHIFTDFSNKNDIVFLCLITLCCLISVGVFSHTRDVKFYQLRVERYIDKGQYVKALEIAENEVATSHTLTALRVYALAHEELLGEKLFEYSLPSDEVALQVPSLTDTLYLLDLQTLSDVQKQDSVAWKRSAWLLQKQPERLLQDLLVSAGRVSLPKHDLEALVMLSEQQTELGERVANIFPKSQEQWKAIQEEFVAFRKLEQQYPDENIRRNYMRRKYGHTYWYYYFYR